jgi:hypothetical protein
MANDPSYVRLATRLQNGIVCDVDGSGWSIAGLDVRKFPEDKQAARYVRAKLNAGLLEPASKAEWEDAHDDAVEQEVLRQAPDYREKASAVQEGQIQRVAREARQRIEEKLGVDADAEFEEQLAADAEDREERLREQEEAGLNTDDPEEQKARTTGQKPRKSGGKKKGGKKASDSEQE